MSKERITTVDDMSDSIDLMRSESDFGVHTDKVQMLAVILTGAERIKLLVVEFCQPFTAFRIFPYPFGKCFFDELLFTLCDSSFLFVENRFLVAVFILNIIKDTHITEVQRFLDDLITVDSARTVGVVNLNIGTVIGFAFNIPFARVFGVMDFYIPLDIPNRIKKFKHESLNIFGRKPSRTETN